MICEHASLRRGTASIISYSFLPTLSKIHSHTHWFSFFNSHYITLLVINCTETMVREGTRLLIKEVKNQSALFHKQLCIVVLLAGIEPDKDNDLSFIHPCVLQPLM